MICIGEGHKRAHSLYSFFGYFLSAVLVLQKMSSTRRIGFARATGTGAFL